MKLHRSIYTQLFPYQQGEENVPAGGAFPAPPGALRQVESSLPDEAGGGMVSSDIPQPTPHQPDQRLNPVIASEQVTTPTAEESVTIDEGNMPAVDQGEPINTPPIETTQLQRLTGNPNRDPILVERMAELRRAPMDQMELYGGSTAPRAPMPMGTPTTMAQPEAMAPGAKGKKTKKTFAEQHPNFKYPYPNPENEEQVAANATAEMREQSQNPVNQDKGWKGLVKELLENFSYGLSKTPQGASVLQALLLGGVGAGAGFVNKGWNERRAAEAALPGLIDAEQTAGQRVQRQFARDDKTRDNNRQDADLKRKIEADENRAAYLERKLEQGDIKLLNDADLIEIRDRIARTNDQNTKRKLALVEQEIKARTERADKDREARLKIAGMGQVGANGRTQVTAANRSKVAALSAAIQMYNVNPTPENQAKVQKAQEALNK